MEKIRVTKYWMETTDDTFFSPPPTASDGLPPVTTANPNSLGELMRYAIFFSGDPFPYDPKKLFKTN